MSAKRIIVVDDSPTVVKFVSFALRNVGFDVLTACDGMDAMEKISEAEPAVDMVITDLNMPNVDGYTLISTLREAEGFADRPIIILSSEEEEHDKLKGLDAGANSYLVKPFRTESLLREVNKLINVEITK